MDPYIEAQLRDDFHADFVPVLRELLIPQVRPSYTVNIERYVYLVSEEDEVIGHVGPDVSVLQHPHAWGDHGEATLATLEPAVLTLPMPRLVEQKFLTIRSRERRDVVTVVEVLSPWNKSPGDGCKEYLQKRSGYLRAMVHIVEIDLLRGGQRLPTIEPLPDGDYFAFVGRWDRRPKLDVYHWLVHERLPVIPIPLKVGDPDVALDLQAAFERTYERGGYDYALDYDALIDPPLPDDSDA
jgi:hypothetical protein